MPAEVETQVVETPAATPQESQIEVVSNGVKLNPTEPAPTEEAPVETLEEQPEFTQEEITKVVENQQAVSETLKDKGVDFEALSTEYQEKGALSEATYESLEKAGFPKNVVDAYVSGIEAQVSRFESTVLGYAGGAEGYKQLASFVQSLGDAEVETYNQILNSQNLGQINSLIKGYQAQMQLKHGTANPTIHGQASASQATSGYSSQKEMTAAINDPRYGKDQSYTSQVRQRIMKSPWN